jgi:protease-4
MESRPHRACNPAHNSRKHSVRPPGAYALAAFLIVIAAVPVHARDNIPSFAEQSNLLATTPVASEGAIGAMFNPAQWGTMQKAEIDFFFSDKNVRDNAWDNWGFSLGKTLGANYRRTDFLHPEGSILVPKNVQDYQIGLGGGKPKGYAGMAFGWSGGDKDLVDRKSFVSFGAIGRPSSKFTYGTVFRTAFGATDRELILSAGWRPTGTPFLLVFGDYDVRTGQQWNRGYYDVGVAMQPFKGFFGSFKYRDGGDIMLGVGIAIKGFGGEALPSWQDNEGYDQTNFIVRVNPPRTSADVDVWKNRDTRFMTMELKGRATYQKYRYGDPHSLPLIDMVHQLKLARKDPTVAGVALNVSGFQANPSMLWELREKLVAIQAEGKEVVIYGERFNFASYYFASIADRLIIHPEGLALIPGVQMSRTYMKNLLAKIGVGFDEWRYFKYKSAYEAFSREDMSDADREQREVMIEDIYAEYADGIARTGRATRAALDSIVNVGPLLLPSELQELGWVDTIGTWDRVGKACEAAAGHKVKLVSHGGLAKKRWQPNEQWGQPPVIAIVYAVGSTSLETGIRARATSLALASFGKRKDVKAVVLRADSPGGDPLASDLVAHELQKLKKAGKTVLVSQGRVAASGGYWISMDGSEISASPFTFTGSIGVIGGWAWNQELGEKLGLTSDHVQLGRSADLFGGLTLPFTGIRTPERDLDQNEREQVRQSIFEMYHRFTSKVAAARGLEIERVRELAQGRVYMGRRALSVELVDHIATLDETIEMAKSKAGIPAEQLVEIEEYPPRKLFRWPSFFRPVAAVVFGEEETRIAPQPAPSYQTLEIGEILRHPGRPLALTPGTLLPAEEMVVH